MIDIPDGYAAVVVALIGALSVAVGAWVGRRNGRISALEHENATLEASNRRLWFVLRGVVDGHLERALADYLAGTDGASRAAGAGAPSVSTSLVFDLAQAAKVPSALLQKDSAALAANENA